MSSENRDGAGDRVDEPWIDVDLADRADGPVAGFAREALQLESRFGEHEGWVEAQVHRRRSRVVASSVDEHVGVDVAGDRVDDPDPVPRVLKHTGLLDVHLDPACEVVECVDRLAPARRLVPGVLRVLPEAATVVDRAKRLLELLLADTLQHDAAAEQHLAEAGAFLLEKRDQLERQTELELLVESAHLERGDDSHRAVVASPLRFESQCEPTPNTGSPVGRFLAMSVPTGSSKTSNPIDFSSSLKYSTVRRYSGV